jgi:hypothetical protein
MCLSYSNVKWHEIATVTDISRLQLHLGLHSAQCAATWRVAATALRLSGQRRVISSSGGRVNVNHVSPWGVSWLLKRLQFPL